MDQERFRDINPDIYTFHPKIAELLRLSLGGAVYDSSSGLSYRLIAHRRLRPQFTDHMAIAGALGMMLLNPDSSAGVALMGYNVIYHNDKLTASIVHTPQGIAERRNDKRWLLPHDTFRTDMVTDSLDLFRAFDIPQVQILSAANHEKVIGGDISAERGLQIIDAVAWDCGITTADSEGNWVAAI